MILDIWFAIGGILGAIIRRYRARDEGDAIRLYVVDGAVAALGGPLLSWVASSIGLGADLFATLATNPIRAVAVGAIPAYVGLDLLTMTSERWRGKPSTEAVKQIVESAKPTPAAAKEIAAVATQAGQDTKAEADGAKP